MDEAGTTRIGLFGGTFDPVHTAHLEVADAVRRALGLDRMLVVVANEPWQKEGERTLTGAEDRYAMVEAAVTEWPGLEPSRMEIDRGGPSYTIDTVRQLSEEEPGADIVLVVGSDVVGGLHHLAGRTRPCGRWSPWPWWAGPASPPAAATTGMANGDSAGRTLRRVEHRAAGPARIGSVGGRTGPRSR